MRNENWDDVGQDKLVRFLSIGAVGVIVASIFAGFGYANHLASGGNKSIEMTRMPESAPAAARYHWTPAPSGPAAPTFIPPPPSPVATNTAGAGPADLNAILRPIAERRRAQIVGPLERLVADVKASDAERYWQGTCRSEVQVADATDALGSAASVTTSPQRYPAVLVPYARAVNREMSSYLKVTREAAAGMVDTGEARTAATRHLSRCEALIGRLDAATRQIAPDLALESLKRRPQSSD